MTLNALNEALGFLGSRINAHSQPNLTRLAIALRDLDNVKLNLKFYGYDVARRLREALPPREGLKPRHVGLASKPSTQADLSTDWAAYWAGQLQSGVVFHRKLWEWIFLLQNLYDHGMLKPGMRALGFGCGHEPIASYLASLGIDVTVTDLHPEKSAGLGWRESNQHTESLQAAYMPHIVSKELFDRHVTLRYVDMNHIPEDLRDYDFNWSICAFEHLGSIAQGLQFVENTMATVRPGGLSIHTTEFNFLDNENTVDNWPTVLFQRKHFEQLGANLRAAGHHVAPMDFDVGTDPLDQFIDLPPYADSWPGMPGNEHIKLSVDGFASTCYGVIARKGG